MPTREDLLDAAERVIRRHGIGGATTKAIATEAGCSEGTIYNHFVDKGELIGDVLSSRLPHFIQHMVDLPSTAGAGTVRGNLAELGALAIAFYREIAPMIGSTIGDPVLRERNINAMREHGRGPHLAIVALAEYLRAEQSLGRVRKRVDTVAAATMFLGGCFQHAFLTLGVPPEFVPQTQDAFLKGASRALLTGLAPEEDV